MINYSIVYVDSCSVVLLSAFSRLLNWQDVCMSSGSWKSAKYCFFHHIQTFQYFLSDTAAPFMVLSKDFDHPVYIHIQFIHSQYLRHLPPRSLFARHNWPRARGRRFPWAPATVPFPFPRACAWSAGFGTRLSPEIKGPLINHWGL